MALYALILVIIGQLLPIVKLPFIQYRPNIHLAIPLFGISGIGLSFFEPGQISTIALIIGIDLVVGYIITFFIFHQQKKALNRDVGFTNLQGIKKGNKEDDENGDDPSDQGELTCVSTVTPIGQIVNTKNASSQALVFSSTILKVYYMIDPTPERLNILVIADGYEWQPAGAFLKTLSLGSTIGLTNYLTSNDPIPAVNTVHAVETLNIFCGEKNGNCQPTWNYGNPTHSSVTTKTVSAQIKTTPNTNVPNTLTITVSINADFDASWPNDNLSIPNVYTGVFTWKCLPASPN